MASYQFFAVAVAAVVATSSGAAHAEEAPQCSTRVTRANVVVCALRASLVVKAEGHELSAAESRRVAVSSLLPSNPVLALSGARRAASGAQSEALNWYATLSQEVEVAGQRGARREAAAASVDAQAKRVQLSKRDAAALAWVAFFETLAAHEEERLAVRLTEATKPVAIVAHAKAEKGLIPPVDADVADAASIRVLQVKLGAERRALASEAALMSRLGLDPSKPATVEGELVPLAGVDTKARSLATNASTTRPEVLVLDAERRAFELRANAFRRARIPNPTVSVFAQNDGFNERVFGGGVAFPIPLLGNVGRTYIGEISEAEDLASRAATDRARVEREIRLDIVTALRAYESRGIEVEAFTPERLTRAEESLRALGQEVEAGRIGVRDAVVTQQALIDLLQANVAARRAWCIASVDLARALGVALEAGTP